MVDLELRRKLAENIRQLIAGQLETGQIDDAFYFRYSSTDDRAVREISTVCYSLYSQPTRRKEQSHAEVCSQEMNELLDRAILFLHTEQEYEWPAENILPGVRALIGLAVFLALPPLMAFVNFGLPLRMVAAQAFMLMFALLGVVIMFVSLELITMKPAPVLLKSKKLKHRGDYAVWPFFRRGDLALANRR